MPSNSSFIFCRREAAVFAYTSDGTTCQPANLLRPRPQQSAQQHELAQMIGVMVRHEQRLAQSRLTVSVRDFSMQVRLAVGDKLLHHLPVCTEGCGASVPSLGARWSIGRRPVAIGPRR